MALEEILGALGAIGPHGALTAIAGPASGTLALIKPIAAFKKTRELRAHMEMGQSHNNESPAGVLRAGAKL